MTDPNQPPPYPGPGPTPPPYGQVPYGQQPPPPYGAPQYPNALYQGPVNPYASWLTRLAGRLLDGIIMAPAYVIGAIGDALYTDAAATGNSQSVGLAMMILGYTAAAAFSIWNTILRQGRTGSSIGKSMVGIVLISEQTGRPIGGWRVFGREILHILDALPCYLGYFWPLWDPKKQTFADKIMSTVVVSKTPVMPIVYPAPGTNWGPPGAAQ